MEQLNNGKGEAIGLNQPDLEFKADGSTYGIVEPFVIEAVIEGVCPMLFRAWDCDEVKRKGDAVKGSKEKKTDNPDASVYRTKDGQLGIPAANIKACLVNAARWVQDPRSPRKSAMDLFKAGILVTPVIASLGKKNWDYLDRRRAVVQRNAVTRVRPALLEGWKVKFLIHSITPEYIGPHLLREAMDRAGRLVGLNDFRPEFGRFSVVSWKQVAVEKVSKDLIK